jgi:beta-glucanase (GH16 family)
MIHMRTRFVRSRVFLPAFVLFAAMLSPAHADPLTQVTVQNFQSDVSEPTRFVVNMPEDNMVATLSSEQPYDGKRDLRVHYNYTGGATEYGGVDFPVQVHAPIHALHVQIYGDNSGVGYGLYLLDATGKTHKYRDGATMKVDFNGWKEITFNLDGPHETWGGTADGKIDFPVSKITFELSNPGHAAEGNLYFANITADSEAGAAQTTGGQIAVTSPEYCSDVKGDTHVDVLAPGFTSVTVHCWKQGGKFGADSVVATVSLDDQGKGAFTFPADQYPHGPVCLTISGQNDYSKDNCYLQLYNKGGVAWNEGLPDTPAPARGLPLAFEDDFTKMPSIGNDDSNTYYDHKPPGGTQDFSSIPFTNFDSPNNPYTQVDTYLRIRADANKNSAGLLSSAHTDGSGLKVTLPCYFECRFIGPNAIGTWPAFWLLTDNMSPSNVQGCDELDIIEAYGGEGPGSPNSYDAYQITPHIWARGDADNALADSYYKMMNNPQRMHRAGIPSTWYETPHTFACKITEDTTTYYCDNIELGHHPTTPVVKLRPTFFLINLATGGGWPVDLSRYNGKADMYVDFVRVYGKKAQ